MTLKIRPGNLPSIIHIPPSKSYANRALILAALKHEPVTLSGLPEATDVIFLKEALLSVGLILREDAHSLTISNSFPDCEKKNPLDISVGEGGTTARFLASMLILGKSPYTLILGDRLKDRPWDEFIAIVKSIGGKADLNGNKLFLQGPVNFPGNLKVDCSKTTQYASGLQLATAFLNTIIVPENMHSSESYWEMTKQQIEYFQNNNDFSIPMDWSSASYPMAFAALKHEISFPGLKYDPFQADAKFVKILASLGMLKETPEGIKVKPNPHVQRDIELDVSDCLDLVPALGFFLAHLEGTHRLSGIENLVHKESDRLGEMIKLLEEFGFKSYTENGTLVIEGSSKIHPPEVHLELPNDHRMVMTGALFLRLHNGGSIAPASAVEKSYPEFFKLIK